MNQAEEMYIISLQSLQDGTFDSIFKIGKAFIEKQQMEGIFDADLQASVHFVKQGQYYTLSIDLQGTISVACDRCLDIFPLSITLQEDFIVKRGNEEDELAEDDSVVIIAPEETEFNLAPQLYEMIMLSIPLKKVHPNEKDCNSDVVSYLKQSKNKKKEQKTDPRWDSLKNIFKN